MYDKIIEILARQLQVNKEDITGDTRIMEDLGADSIDVVEILMAIEESFGVNVPDSDILNLKSPNEIREYIIARGGDVE